MSKRGTFDDLVDGIENFYKDADEHIRAHLKKGEPENGVVSCHQCTEAACCTQKLWVHFYEALPILRRLKRENRDTPELRQKLVELGRSMEGSSAEEWFEKRIPCVFLKDEKCTIYEQRPLRCRSYWVVSPPELCRPPSNKTVNFVNDSEILAISIQYSRNVHHAISLKETTKRVLLGTLPRVLLIALEAYDSDDYREKIRREKWPSDTSLEDWLEGRNPFGLHQIKKTKEG